MQNSLLIPIYCEQTTIKRIQAGQPSAHKFAAVLCRQFGRLEALHKFDGDVWDRVVCILMMGVKRDSITMG